MKKPIVDEELCIGCGVCAEFCPEVFEIRDEKSWVVGPDKCSTCDCEEAADSCPVSAIEFEEYE
ncbi:MAG: ferredoxin [Pseudomonadota bacterium]